MNQHKFSFRVGVLILLIAVMAGIFGVRLYDVQVTQASQVDHTPSGSHTYRTRVTAARGEILDRNGKVLIGNRASYNLTLIYAIVFSAENPNENLRKLTNLCNELGLEMTDHFPVTMEKPYTYTTDEYSSTWNSYFKTFLDERGWDSDISAPQLIRRLKDTYHLPADWTEEETRRVISIRYELDLRRWTSLPTYVLLNDVDSVSLAAITELNIPGVNVETSTVRQYNTTYAAHILGRIGLMNAEEYEIYKEKDYAMDAYVGKEGLEKAFEDDLHGTDGLRVTTISADGTVLEEYYKTMPQAGKNIELTIDIDLQKVSEDALKAHILSLREDDGDAEGGAVVVQEVKTGQILACASYPTFDPATYSQKYNELLETDFAPLYNRALQAAYPPGSTYKMVTTIASIDSGTIGRWVEIEDKGIYRRFEDVGYTPRCMLYTTAGATHGYVNAMEALAVSCNYYFYEVGYQTGITKIDEVAKALGLGEATGVELDESVGRRANAETKKLLYSKGYDGWYDADTVAAAIGQSENRFTPMQLACYTSALANHGTRYKATFLQRVLSSDYSELLYESTPVVASQLNISDEAYAAYTEGMRLSVTWANGTSHYYLGDYDVAVCAKTGTAEHGGNGSDNAAYVLYAPADDPQIAIAVYVEKGTPGSRLAKVARAILDAYFSTSSNVDTVPAENIAN
jgi:penicillin-binding protein 2